MNDTADSSSSPLPDPPRRRFRFYLFVGFIFAMLLVWVVWWMGPAPPRHLVIATGEKEGAYYELGLEYQRRLEKMGIKVDLVTTEGSVDNLHKLLDHEVDVAFAQAGTYDRVSEQDPDHTLRGIGAVQQEPVWVFYRGEVRGNIAELQRRPGNEEPVERPLRINIGQPNSGTRSVARAILHANGIDEDDATIEQLSMAEASERLRDGTLDVSFFVSNPSNHIIRDELMPLCDCEEDSTKPIHLLNFTRHLAYTQRFPYLSTVTLGQGVLSLQNDIPSKDIKLLSTQGLLVCRKDLHPHAVEQILIAARQIHTRGAVVAAPQQFPTLEGVDLELHPAAEAYLTSGQSFLTRLLPYWALWLVFKLQLVIIPLLLVWLPFFKILPFVYRLRINLLLRHHYKSLRDIEDAISDAEDIETIEQEIAKLESLRTELDQVSRKVPGHLQINVYQWRLHVAHVRAEAREHMWRLRQARSKEEVTPAKDTGEDTHRPE